MHPLSSFVCLLASLLPLAWEASGTPLRRMPASNNAAGKAVYFITNEAVNSVVALPVGRDGTLSDGTVTETCGAGSVALDTENQPAVPDALVGQSALTIAGNYIFAVNAGSNTLSMLAISPSDATQLTLVGKPVEIPGEFPNTVAASTRHNLVCVGTTGALAGVSCSLFSESGLGPMDELRSFELGQTTPPIGPTNTVSQTFFSADENTLFTTVKGDPPTNKTGFLSAFAVEPAMEEGMAGLSQVDSRSSPDGNVVLFGAQAIPGTSNIFATDAAFGASILAVDPLTLQATSIAAVEIAGQVATCWATISDATGTAFVTDVAVNRVVEMSLQDASIIGVLDLSANGDPGLIDLQAAGDFVYALSPGNGTTDAAITVLDVSGGPGSATMIQHFGLRGVAGSRAMGMAVLV